MNSIEETFSMVFHKHSINEKGEQEIDTQEFLRIKCNEPVEIEGSIFTTDIIYGSSKNNYANITAIVLDFL